MCREIHRSSHYVASLLHTLLHVTSCVASQGTSVLKGSTHGISGSCGYLRSTMGFGWTGTTEVKHLSQAVLCCISPLFFRSEQKALKSWTEHYHSLFFAKIRIWFGNSYINTFTSVSRLCHSIYTLMQKIPNPLPLSTCLLNFISTPQSITQKVTHFNPVTLILLSNIL